jgi:tetratricopeptide (TPR) repeat protein
MTLGAVAAHAAIEDLALVEIEPAVTGATEQFADLNDHVLDDPRLRISFQDGRNFLKTTSRKFDVITADPIHPWAYGSVYLYTVEYYQLAKARLNQGGIMCQWLPAYGLSDEEFRSVVATFARTFDNITVWQASLDVLLIGSDAPVRVDLAELERRMAEPAVARQLGWVGLETPLAFLAEFAMDDAAVRNYSRGAMINTDDNLYLEFSSPFSIGASGWVENLQAIDEFRTPATRVATNLSSRFPSLEVAQASLSRYQSAKSATVKVQLQSRKRGRIAALQAAIRSLRSVLAELPDYGRARIELADRLTRLAEARLSQGRPQLAAERAREALELSPDDAAAHHHLGTALTLLGESLPAIEHLEIAVRLRPYDWHAYYVLSLALKNVGRTREATTCLREGMALQPGDPTMEKLLGELQASEANASGE